MYGLAEQVVAFAGFDEEKDEDEEREEEED